MTGWPETPWPRKRSSGGQQILPRWHQITGRSIDENRPATDTSGARDLLSFSRVSFLVDIRLRVIRLQAAISAG